MIGPDTSEWFNKIRPKLKEAKPVNATTPDDSGSVTKEAVMQDLAKVQSFKESLSLFKIVILIIGIIFLVLYYDRSINGRYSIVDKADYTIIDHRTGILYVGDDSEKPIKTIIILDQVNGTVRYVPLKRLP